MRRAGVEPAKPGISVQCVCRFTTGACCCCRARHSRARICGPSRRPVAWTKGERGCPRFDGEAPRVPRRARVRPSSSASFGAPGGSRTRNQSPESESGAFTNLTTDAFSSPTGDRRDHKSERANDCLCVSQSGWLDLPQRPPAPEAGVLLAELHPDEREYDRGRLSPRIAPRLSPLQRAERDGFEPPSPFGDRPEVTRLCTSRSDLFVAATLESSHSLNLLIHSTNHTDPRTARGCRRSSRSRARPRRRGRRSRQRSSAGPRTRARARTRPPCAGSSR